jgi:hypothetical protein
MADPTPAPVGVDRVGRSIRKLESTRRFFCQLHRLSPQADPSLQQ